MTGRHWNPPTLLRAFFESMNDTQVCQMLGDAIEVGFVFPERAARPDEDTMPNSFLRDAAHVFSIQLGIDPIYNEHRWMSRLAILAYRAKEVHHGDAG